MLNFIARRYAKNRYVFNQLVEAATNDLNAGLSLRLSKEKRELASRLNAEADQMDARIKEVSEMEEKGYYACEDGHEFMVDSPVDPIMEHGRTCGKEPKFIKREQMTGQEKYESDKERGEAEEIAKQKRDQAKAEEDNAAQSEKTAQYFRGLAESNRRIAEKVRRL
jgi:hypothetical protein